MEPHHMRGRKTLPPSHIDIHETSQTPREFTPKSRSRPRGNFFFEQSTDLKKSKSQVSFQEDAQIHVIQPEDSGQFDLARVRSAGVIWKQDMTPLTAVPGGIKATMKPMEPKLRRRNSMPSKSRPKPVRSFQIEEVVGKTMSAPHLRNLVSVVPPDLMKWIGLLCEGWGFQDTPLSPLLNPVIPKVYQTDSKGIVLEGKLKGASLLSLFSKLDGIRIESVIKEWQGKQTEELVLAGRIVNFEANPHQLVLSGNGTKSTRFTFRLIKLDVERIELEINPRTGTTLSSNLPQLTNLLPRFVTDDFHSLDVERFKLYCTPLPPYTPPQAPLKYHQLHHPYATPCLLQPLSRSSNSFSLRVNILKSGFATAIPVIGTEHHLADLTIPDTTSPPVLDGLKYLTGYSRSVLLGSSLKQFLHLPGYTPPSRPLEKKSVSGFFQKDGIFTTPFEPPRPSPWQSQQAWGLIKHRDGSLVPCQVYIDKLSGQDQFLCLIRVDPKASEILVTLGQNLEPKPLIKKPPSKFEDEEDPTNDDDQLHEIGIAVGPPFGSPGAFGFVRRGWKMNFGPVVVKSVRLANVPPTRRLESRRVGDRLEMQDSVLVPVELDILLNLSENRCPSLPLLLDFTWKGEDFDTDDSSYFHIVFEPLTVQYPTCDTFDLIAYFIEKGKPLGLSMVRQIWQNTVEAVSWLHKNQIVHRDIKDENVVVAYEMIEREEEGRRITSLQVKGVQLVDFGSAAYFSERMETQVNVNLWAGWQQDLPEDLQTLALFDTFVGTLEWAAPEILRGIPYPGPLQDGFSLGMLLYTLIYRQQPFGTAEDMMEKEANVEFPYEYEVYSKDRALWNCMCGLLRVDARIQGEEGKDGQVLQGRRWTLERVTEELNKVE